MSQKLSKFAQALSCLLLIGLFSSQGFAGGDSSGGGGNDTVSAGALTVLLEGGGLKRAMKNYISTLPLDRIEDADVRSSLSRMMQNEALVADIMTPNNYYPATADRPCVDAFDKRVAASTTIGKIGGRICFDIEKLVVEYKEFSEEEVMIHLAALAFHEHVHHFQQPSEDQKIIRQNEAEANRVAGYILITAKFIQIPLLEWAPSNLGNEFEEIKKMYDQIRAKERAFLRVPESDYANYPDYKNQSDKGLFRLLPREIYDGKLSMPGSGAYYSFSGQAHDYDVSQIGLEQNELSTGFSGCDFGFITDLGQVPLESVSVNDPALKYLLEFSPAHKPADDNEPEVRRQQRQAQEGVSTNGFLYKDRAEKVVVGGTFALRAISFDNSDILVLFKVVRALDDGSLIIAWKKVKTFPVYSCNSKLIDSWFK